MRCTMRNCKNVRDLDSVTQLCPPCNSWIKDFNKGLSSQERRQYTQEEVQNQNLFLSSPPLPVSDRICSPSSQPIQQASVTPFTAGLRPSSTPTEAPPPIDVRSIQNSYNKLKNSSGSPVTLETLHGQTLDMFALMLNIHAKMSETDAVRDEVTKVKTRIDALESKVGGINEVSKKLGLAIRLLPLPSTGFTDLDIARQILAEIRAPGIDVNRDVVKAIRKIPSKPPNTGQPILGTVLVEMKNEESRASIMKNKHSLQNHPDDSIKRVIIKNIKSREQMMIENLGNNLLKRIPGCQNIIVGNNGQLREDLHQSHPQNPSRFQVSSQIKPNPNRSQHNHQNQQPVHYRNYCYQPSNTPSQQPKYHNTHYQPQVQPVFENNDVCASMRVQPPMQHHSPALVPSFPSPPPAALSQPQHSAGPSRYTEPDLHLPQPAQPHHGHSEQLHYRQQVQAWQERQQDQNHVRADISDSD